MRNDGFDKSHKFRFVAAVRRGAISGNFFMIPAPKMFDSGRSRTHDVGTGQFLRDITRNSPLTKYPKFDGDTANHRGATVR